MTELSDLMKERNVDLAKSYELISGGKVSNNGKHEINWQALTDEFLNIKIFSYKNSCFM